MSVKRKSASGCRHGLLPKETSVRRVPTAPSSVRNANPGLHPLRCLRELPCKFNRLGDAFLAGDSLHTIPLANLEPPQGGEVLTLPLHGGTRLRRHREPPLG